MEWDGGIGGNGGIDFLAGFCGGTPHWTGMGRGSRRIRVRVVKKACD